MRAPHPSRRNTLLICFSSWDEGARVTNFRTALRSGESHGTARCADSFAQVPRPFWGNASLNCFSNWGGAARTTSFRAARQKWEFHSAVPCEAACVRGLSVAVGRVA